VLIVLAAIAVLILAVVAIGMSLPVRHRAGRQATFQSPASEIFKAITTPQEFPTWRTGVTKVDLLPAHDGKSQFREIGKNGSITYEVERSTPDTELVTRIADPSLPFGGTWTYTLARAGASTTVRIVEDGEIYNPIFRFVSRFIMGHTATIDQFLRDLGKKLGQLDVAVVDAS
jgi:uncharacterized protein YndB with AHSA1/START domain